MGLKCKKKTLLSGPTGLVLDANFCLVGGWCLAALHFYGAGAEWGKAHKHLGLEVSPSDPHLYEDNRKLLSDLGTPFTIRLSYFIH